MLKLASLLITALIIALSTQSYAQDLPDGHAPISVMGDHTHKQGEVMFSYRFMRMYMDNMRDGQDDLSSSEILNASPANPTNYAVTPTSMSSEMHMFGAMYAPSDDLTLMLMTNYASKEMAHLTDSGATFTTRAEGFGDTTVTGLISLLDKPNHSIHLNAGVSLPTGSINQRDDTPAAPSGTTLPFKMQLGSGTFDLKPGVTYRGYHDRYGWGLQLASTLRMGENYKDYTLGDIHSLKAWGSYRFADWISGSLSLSGKTEGRISGENLNPSMPMMIATTDPNNYGGETVTAGFGVNLIGQSGWLKNERLAIDVNLPVYQDLNGPQMALDSTVTIGLQTTF